MKLLFLCGSAQPGKDGVGDYTRRLCGVLIRKGHHAQILALCDKQAASFVSEYQEVESTKVLVNRIPITALKKQRLIYAQGVLNTFNPHWISLQYVPYSFNAKGLPFWLPRFLKQLRGQHQWHIMFHELWLGIDKESSFKHILIGQLQQKTVKQLLKNLKIRVIHTQSSHSQFVLKSKNIHAFLLPLFGNIPVIAAKDITKESFKEFIVFGSIHLGAPFKNFVQSLIDNISKEDSLKLNFVFIGKNGVLLDEYIQILESKNIKYKVLGVQTPQVISGVLLNGNYGISTTPYLQSEKSGVVAAYREHGLPIVNVSRKWTPKIGSHIVPKNLMLFSKNKIKFDKNTIKRLDIENIYDEFVKSLIK